MPGPNLTSPADQATNVALSPSFTWDAFAGASEYQIQIALEAAFQEVIFTYLDAASPLDLLALVGSEGYPLDFGTKYYWRVRARVDGVLGDWSSTRSFTVISANLPYLVNLQHKRDGKATELQQFREGS